MLMKPADCADQAAASAPTLTTFFEFILAAPFVEWRLCADSKRGGHRLVLSRERQFAERVLSTPSGPMALPLPAVAGRGTAGRRWARSAGHWRTDLV
jgi:hypothetical protein